MNLYWVGGTGTWGVSNTANWSTTSGGSGGASVPGAADVAIFNASSGGGAVTIDVSSSVPTTTATGFTGSFALADGAKLQLSAGITHNCTAFSGPATAIKGSSLLCSSSAGSAATLSDSGGANTLDNVTATDIAFSGGATWIAGANFVHGGGNTGIPLPAVAVVNPLFGDVA